ncbi:hypothetical protein AAULR_21994, partial [Lacticaseibacillus rhamnosus MTCC 5462]
HAVITLRADFPHDSYWKQGTMTFSDGSQMVIHFSKTDNQQTFAINKSNIRSIRLSELVKAEDDSPFPALTELEVYGSETFEEMKH